MSRRSSLPKVLTCGICLRRLYAQQPSLRTHDKSILIGAGVEFVDRSYQLKPGDEIAIMPPVQADNAGREKSETALESPRETSGSLFAKLHPHLRP